MSEKVVDLGAIRGDWDFHARYVTNAIEQTLKRTLKNWKALKAKAPAAGQVPMDGELMDEFMEACGQTRALTDDILLLRETQPKRRRSGRAVKQKPTGRQRKSSR